MLVVFPSNFLLACHELLDVVEGAVNEGVLLVSLLVGTHLEPAFALAPAEALLQPLRPRDLAREFAVLVVELVQLELEPPLERLDSLFLLPGRRAMVLWCSVTFLMRRPIAVRR